VLCVVPVLLFSSIPLSGFQSWHLQHSRKRGQRHLGKENGLITTKRRGRGKMKSEEADVPNYHSNPGRAAIVLILSPDEGALPPSCAVLVPFSGPEAKCCFFHSTTPTSARPSPLPVPMLSQGSPSLSPCSSPRRSLGTHFLAARASPSQQNETYRGCKYKLHLPYLADEGKGDTYSPKPGPKHVGVILFSSFLLIVFLLIA